VAIQKQESEKEFKIIILDKNEKPVLKQNKNLNVFENEENEKVQGGCIVADDPEGDEVRLLGFTNFEYFLKIIFENYF